MIDVTIPPSKSIAQRLIFLGSMGPGGTIKNIPENDDVASLWNGLNSIQEGYSKRLNFSNEISCDGFKGHLKGGVTVSAKLGGLPARLLIASAMRSVLPVIITGEGRLLKRSMRSLFYGVNSGGGQVSSIESKSYLPVAVKSLSSELSENILIPMTYSSQSATAFLLLAATSTSSHTIKLEKPIYSQSYLDMTIDLICKFGGIIEKHEDEKFLCLKISPVVRKINASVPGDASSGVFAVAASIITGEKMCIHDWFADGLQPDDKVISVLKSWGVKFKKTSVGIQVDPSLCRPNKEIDCSCFPDGAIALAAIAANYDYAINLKGLDTWPYKESNRLESVALSLSKLGVTVNCGKNNMVICGPIQNGGNVDTFGDHRLAFLGGVLSLTEEGVQVKKPEVVSKSWPNFWNELSSWRRSLPQAGIV